MIKTTALVIVTVLLALILCACASASNAEDIRSEQGPSEEIIGTEPIADNTNGIDMNNGSSSSNENRQPVPQELETIPEEYFSPAAQKGTLIELTYDTYESKTYEQKTQRLEKRAIVYLPHGYSEDQQYNVFYLMHGGWGNETTTLGTPERPSPLKNVIDNAIADKEFEPLIIVCPTYNNESPEDSANFNLALELNRNYHNELLNDLIPAVESTYST